MLYDPILTIDETTKMGCRWGGLNLNKVTNFEEN